MSLDTKTAGSEKSASNIHDEDGPPDNEQKATHGEILKSSAIIGASSLLTILISIVRTKAMAMFLGPAGFGLLAIYQSVVELLVACGREEGPRKIPGPPVGPWQPTHLVDFVLPPVHREHVETVLLSLRDDTAILELAAELPRQHQSTLGVERVLILP